ncbi:hypothetical protein MXD59_17335 [Frankia sp. Ag45/Mut15]|uniref:LysM domain-containing protein n=1 Tax=Frankia umida TaxID=573489 RepID=A0ABT0K144_9ACTN|nr:hypothetical protein [Frankia umida]MCK9877515.1 hypothetical protein [Frankia umida]
MSQRTGTKLLTAQERPTVRALLGLPIPPEELTPKPADANQPDHHVWERTHDSAAAKDAFATELKAALKTAIDDQEPAIQRKENARSIDLRSLLPAAAAAREIVDAYFADWTRTAALPASLLNTRQHFSFTVDGDAPTIVSMADLPTRTRLRWTTEPANVIGFLMGTDGPRAVATRHSFHHENGTTEESAFYQQAVVEPFLAAHRDALIRYEKFVMSMTDPNTARVFIAPWVPDWKATETELTSAAVAQKKWNIFANLVHEYIHVLQHPLLPTATGRSVVVREGICEYLAVQVVRHVGTWSDEQLTDLNKRIVGAGNFRASRNWLTGYTATEEYRSYVDRVTQAIQTVGVNAIYAAFFQGHTEFLGTAVGHGGCQFALPAVATAAGGTRRLPFPATSGRRGHDWISRGTAIPAPTFAELNADVELTLAQGFVDDGLDLQISVPNFRAHRVLTFDGVSETWEQIAAQNGTSVSDLLAINSPDGRLPPLEDLGLEWLLVRDI